MNGLLSSTPGFVDHYIQSPPAAHDAPKINPITGEQMSARPTAPPGPSGHHAEHHQPTHARTPPPAQYVDPLRMRHTFERRQSGSMGRGTYAISPEKLRNIRVPAF